MSNLDKRYNELCGEVKVTYDYDLVKEYEKNMQDEEYLKQLELKKKEYYLDLKEQDKNRKHKNNYELGENSSLNKIERLKKFKDGYDKGEFVTLSSAVSYMKRKVANGLSYNTCKKYAEELGIYIFDDKNDNWIIGNKPEWINEI